MAANPGNAAAATAAVTAGTVELTDEKVTFVADSNHPDRFLPRVAVSKNKMSGGRTTVEKSFRPFEADDMTRVLDFKDFPDPPDDTTMRVCESGSSRTGELLFPVRHVVVRGGFLFYFDIEDVEDQVNGHFVSYIAPPVGVIPLDKVDVAPPPGGRRVFREHAHTDARNGYEFVLIHAPDSSGTETTRPPSFLVAESLATREKWIKALSARAEVSLVETKLRPQGGGGAPTRPRTFEQLGPKSVGRNQRTRRGGAGIGGGIGVSGHRRSLLADDDGEQNDEEERDIDAAKREFGVVDFADDRYLNDFFQSNNDFEAGSKIDALEQWQSSIKRRLRGAVLEQYEYFVEASGEMTTMGKEVSALKNLVDTQTDLIKEMKDIDFSVAFNDHDQDSLASDDDQQQQQQQQQQQDIEGAFGGGRKRGRRRKGGAGGGATRGAHSDDENSVASSLSSGESGTRNKSNHRRDDPDGDEFDEQIVIEIPAWLEDVSEEISAFIKECRYTDATDLLFKAKQEVNEILANHDRPTDAKLGKKQHTTMLNILSTLDGLSERMCNRLVEGLRRKNEALKQAGKRERSDALSLMAPMVSPCSLGDDQIPLHLLVKLGKTQDAATAFAARRSLLLLESLHERPISGTGNVDLVIYAAQLSQSFFSCLAGAVEGFLDLFMAAAPNKDDSDDASTLMTSATRLVPPGALASIVLWCDSELSKFASAFGGTRILGNLALSPPPRQDVTSKARMVGFEESEGNQTAKERAHAVDVASQCVGQAFQYASENLDSIGLPLTPRLAEYIRSRLKGCESEVSKKLDMKWKHITFEWEIEIEPEDIPMDERPSRRR